MFRNLLLCSMSWCLVGGRSAFSNTGKAGGPPGTAAPWGLLLAKDKAQYKVLVLLCIGPKDFPPEVRLSLSLILTRLWEWPQKKDGEYKKLRCFQESKLAPLPA